MYNTAVLFYHSVLSVFYDVYLYMHNDLHPSPCGCSAGIFLSIVLFQLLLIFVVQQMPNVQLTSRLHVIAGVHG